MNRIRIALLLALLGVQPLAAQTVVRPAPPLDSARATLRDALVELRDSLVTIDGAAARLQRDYRETSGSSLLSRARQMQAACARSLSTVPPTRQVVLSTKLNQPVKAKRRKELVGALDHLKGSLTTCETEFAAMSQPDQAERVRGYGNDRALRVQRALRSYEHVLQDFLGALGIRMVPAGTGGAPGK